MKFSAVLTKKQAEEMLVYLGDLFTEVRLLDIEAVKHEIFSAIERAKIAGIDEADFERAKKKKICFTKDGHWNKELTQRVYDKILETLE